MISEEIYMIGSYFHKLNQLFVVTLNSSHFCVRYDSMLLILKRRRQILLLKRRSKQAVHHLVQVQRFFHGEIWMTVGLPHPNTFSDGVRRNIFETTK